MEVIRNLVGAGAHSIVRNYNDVPRAVAILQEEACDLGIVPSVVDECVIVS